MNMGLDRMQELAVRFSMAIPGVIEFGLYNYFRYLLVNP